MFQPFEIGSGTSRPVAVSPESLFVIAGPCVIESEEHTLKLAREIAAIAKSENVPLIFKASFDKANRTSIASYRGPGIEKGLDVLARVRTEVGVPVLTDVHEPNQAAPAAEAIDVLQIPAFLCRQTDLIAACARTGRPINIKKGQFLAPWDMAHPVTKARESGATQIILTERGFSFGYNNLVVDMRSLVEIAKLDCPVVFDGTHSVQMPGASGGASGGKREYIEPLVRAATAVGVNGIFVEVHDAPERALSDGPNQLPLDRFGALLRTIKIIDAARRQATK